MVLPRVEQTNQANAERTALKAYILLTVYGLNRLLCILKYMHIYTNTNTFMHAIKIDGKRGCEFEGEQGGVLLLLSFHLNIVTAEIFRIPLTLR